MKLIISEKSIAGRKIAKILSNGKAIEKQENNISVFYFDDFKLIPLKGHIINIDFPRYLNYWLGVDIRKLLKASIEVIPTALNIINLLKKNAMVTEVIIATDCDREGELIGLEAVNYLKKENPKIKISRIYFSAITKKDLENAFKNLTKLDFNLAASAEARRLIDLYYGSTLTRFISITAGKLGKDFLSAGRVQIPTLALITERELERKKFKRQKFWQVSALLSYNKKEFKASHKRTRFNVMDEALKAKENASKTKKAKLINVIKKEKKLAKPLPFDTTSFLREAIKIGFSAHRAMQVAESLYMQGLISYPRTDNQVYPNTISLTEILIELKKLKEFEKVCDHLLKKGFKPSAGKLAKDHPPIYVVSIPERKLQGQEKKLFDLIARRFIATLADDALIESVKASFDLNSEIFNSLGQTIKNPGFLEIYPFTSLKEELLPDFSVNDFVNVINVDLREGETKPRPRYSQGTLISIMAKKNLGTKATRPEIIKKLIDRGYVQGAKELIPTNVGIAVINVLSNHAPKLVTEKLTAFLENEMDEIASGKKLKEQVIQESNVKLQEILNTLIKEQNEIKKELKEALNKDSLFFSCPNPECDGKLMLRFSRNRKRFLGCSNYPKCTVTLPLPQKGVISLTPKTCIYCNLPIIKVIGRRFKYEMCLSMNCKTKEEWKKKKELKELKKKEKAMKVLKKENKQKTKEKKKKKLKSNKNNSRKVNS